uniref:Uncharacterized protein n=1 Tax=Myripristis murdjan TaxID=586833 RepID=A0A668AB35_9TELE
MGIYILCQKVKGSMPSSTSALSGPCYHDKTHKRSFPELGEGLSLSLSGCHVISGISPCVHLPFLLHPLQKKQTNKKNR